MTWMCFQLPCRQPAPCQRRPLPPLQSRLSRRRWRRCCCRRRTRSQYLSRHLLQGSPLRSPLHSSRRHSSRRQRRLQQRQPHRPCHSGRQSALESWSAGSVQRPQQVHPTAPGCGSCYCTCCVPHCCGAQGAAQLQPAQPASCSGGSNRRQTSAKHVTREHSCICPGLVCTGIKPVRVFAAGVALPLLGRDAGGPILRFSELFPTDAKSATAAPPRRRRVRFARPGTGATCPVTRPTLLRVQ